MSVDPITSNLKHAVKASLSKVRERIERACAEAGRPEESVNLLAVSKTKPVAAVVAAREEGQEHFGENYLQDALVKVANLEDVIWHFIGAIQSNKTKPIAESFSYVHTVSSLKVARRLNNQRPDHLPPLKIFLQVNIDGDGNKAGLTPAELPEFAAAVFELDRLNIQGLMTLPTQTSSLENQRKPFRALRELQETCLPTCKELSMGMSGDLEAAILEGATWVRIGTDIFGARER